MAKDNRKNDEQSSPTFATQRNKLIKSKYKTARIAPRKVMLVANAIRGMKVAEAVRFLDFNENKSAGIIKGVVQTAIANGAHNFGIEKESLYVADVVIGPGPVRKGGRFGAKGAFKPIWKRTTHITVVLASKDSKEKPKAIEAQVVESKKETK